MRILVVEDDQIQRTVITNLLRIAGYQVLSVDNGRRLVEHYETWEPDWIVMDISGTDGMLALEALRKRGLKPRVVLWTGKLTEQGGEKVAETARPLGVEAHITKDYLGHSLLEFLQSVT